MRLMTIKRASFANDYMLSSWLIVTLGQIQIFVSLIGYTSPALKKTMIDLATNYGAISESQAVSHRRPSQAYAMKDLRYHKNTGGKSWRSSVTGKKALPLVSSSSQAQPVIEVESDGDSQKGIIRRDEVEVTFSHPRSKDAPNESWR